MTTYNFDREIDRKNTNSLKYDFAVERGRDVDVLPFVGGGYGFSGAEACVGCTAECGFPWDFRL